MDNANARDSLERVPAAETAILLIDAQERLAAAMPEARIWDLVRAARILIDGGRPLGARVLVTEQYPKGLGQTLAALLPIVEQAFAPRIEKLHFSACASEAVMDFLGEAKPRRIVVIGMEAHVCVFQTVRDLTARGHSVHLPVDGVVSRRDDHREIGIALAARAGAIPTTAETIAFDWLERAGTPEFKALSQLLR